ncbi:MAG: serine/threonine-protein kinase [Victivallaceae bacterium]|nr:serine/threonine-protein kinase [Victivallaceae bacterium]
MQYFCKKCRSYTERDDDKCCPKCGADLKDAVIAPSTVIAGFKIIRELGHGANGVVYLAEQTSLDRQVALKILPDAQAEDPDFVKAFLKEARAAARLNHPNIIQVYDAGVTDGGIYFLAMELIDGEALESRILAKGALSAAAAVKIAIELAGALEYSWNKEHLFHGDIKPGNIMIGRDGQTKLADFGLAKTVFDETGEDIMATPMYAPPEVIRGERRQIGFKSDMYSFGVTLYEILCGTPPFDATDCDQVMDMHLHKNPLPLIERRPGIDRALSELVDQLLSKNPGQRPPSWTAVLKKLQAVKTDRTEPKSRRRLVAGIIISAIIGILAAAAILSRTQKPTPPHLPKLAVIPRPLPLPQVKTQLSFKDAKSEKKQAELEYLLRTVDRLNNGLLAASRLRFRILMLQKPPSLIKAQPAEIAAALAKLNQSIEQKQQAAAAAELAELRAELARERKLAEARRLRECSRNSLVNRKSKIFALTAQFLALPKEQQTSTGLQRLLEQNPGPDKALPEDKVLNFLVKMLPAKYNRNRIAFEHPKQLIGKKLPWKIRNLRYTVIGSSRQSLHLQAKLSKGVFSRRKLRLDALSDAHWKLLVKEFIIKASVKPPAANLRELVCRLLLSPETELFTALVRKYYPTDTAAWLDCRQLVLSAPAEAAAGNAWHELVRQMSELNPAAYGLLHEFKNKYAATAVYREVRESLENHQERAAALYPEAAVERLRLASLSVQSPDDRVFAAAARYSDLECVPVETRTLLRTLTDKKLRHLADDRHFAGEFGIFRDVPCGKIYGWLTPASGNLRPPPYCFPALMDVDAWNQLRHCLGSRPDLEFDSPRWRENAGYYPFLLYGAGLAALRCGRRVILNQVFAVYQELVLNPEAPDATGYALAASLALKMGNIDSARKILAQYRPKTTPPNEAILIPLLQLRVLLAGNPVDETAVAELIAAVRKQFAAVPALSNDLKLLERLELLICAGFERPNSLPPEFFRQSTYPHLHAVLWLEAAARDQLLRRSSIRIPALLQGCRSILTPSAFRSELFRKITELNLARRPFTPEQLCRELNSSLAELKPCATDSYPALLTLRFAAELFAGCTPPEQLAGLADKFIFHCPVFSPAESRFRDILRVPSPAKVLEECRKYRPPADQMFPLRLLAAVRATRPDEIKAYILKLKSCLPGLSWTERLLAGRFIELLEAGLYTDLQSKRK